jgi:hypothetical protein
MKISYNSIQVQLIQILFENRNVSDIKTVEIK